MVTKQSKSKHGTTTASRRRRVIAEVPDSGTLPYEEEEEEEEESKVEEVPAPKRRRIGTRVVRKRLEVALEHLENLVGRADTASKLAMDFIDQATGLAHDAKKARDAISELVQMAWVLSTKETRE